MKKETNSREMLKALPNRITKVFKSPAQSEVWKYLSPLWESGGFKPMKIMVVGSGEFYASALLIAQAISDVYRTTRVSAHTYQEAIDIITQKDRIIGCEYKPKYDVVVALKNDEYEIDLQRLAKAMAHRDFKCLVISNKDEEKCLKLNMIESKVINYLKNQNRFEEDNSKYFDTLATVSPFTDDWDGGKKYNELLEKGEEEVSKIDIETIANSLKKSNIVHVFCEWNTLPVAEDIKFKFTNSGIAQVVLHDKRNFMHGEYKTVLKNLSGLVINLNLKTVGINIKTQKAKTLFKKEFDTNFEKLIDAICKENSIPYYTIEMVTLFCENHEYNLPVMAMLPYFIEGLKSKLETNISFNSEICDLIETTKNSIDEEEKY